MIRVIRVIRAIRSSDHKVQSSTSKFNGNSYFTV